MILAAEVIISNQILHLIFCVGFLVTETDEKENVIFCCGVFPKGQKVAERTVTVFPSQSIS